MVSWPAVGTVARHLSPLAALISGIVGSQSTQLPHIAAKVPNGTTPAAVSHALRGGATMSTSWRRSTCCPLRTSCCVISPCRRWYSSWMAAAWAAGVPRYAPCRLERPRPAAGWRVRQGPKGHFPEDLHIALVELIREVIPEGAQVVFVGDGECDGTALPATLHEAGWAYAAARP